MTELSPADVEQQAKLSRCEAAIGYHFQDQTLLLAALTHASGANHRLASNERLEFLGDAILGAVVCEVLYCRFTDYLEGDLTKIKSMVVSRVTCAKVSETLGLRDCLILGKGMAQNPEVPLSLMADVFESLVAAMHLDSGGPAARDFILRHIMPEIDLAEAGQLEGNYKSQLQQVSQQMFGCTPVYTLVREQGPDHAKQFQVAVEVAGQQYESAWGRNKKEAEQKAAGLALAELVRPVEEQPYATD